MYTWSEILAIFVSCYQRIVLLFTEYTLYAFIPTYIPAIFMRELEEEFLWVSTQLGILTSGYEPI